MRQRGGVPGSGTPPGGVPGSGTPLGGCTRVRYPPGGYPGQVPPPGGVPGSGTPRGGTQARYPPGGYLGQVPPGGSGTPPGGTQVRYPPGGVPGSGTPPGGVPGSGTPQGGYPSQVPPRGGYPGRTTEGLLTTRRAVCLLRSRRRTFLFYHVLDCPLDHYKSEDSSAGSCTRCPDNSHTTSTTSNNILQCICDPGYEGPDGGPCTSKMSYSS